MPQKSSKAPKKKKEKLPPPEDHSDWKLEVWLDPKTKRVYTMDWEGHIADKTEEPKQN